MTEQYIWVNGWEKFQSVQMKHGRPWSPPWIKLYPELLSNDDFLSLSPRRRSILVGIWLLMARTGLKLGSSPARIGRLLGDDSVRRRDLVALNHAGFIRFCSGTELERLRKSSTLDVDVEREKEQVLLKA